MLMIMHGGAWPSYRDDVFPPRGRMAFDLVLFDAVNVSFSLDRYKGGELKAALMTKDMKLSAN
ncbi:hypothetical protein [uncultured Pelagimonas sp.]|uniref:hypothetical protein n=1 Tax=uncultured Pelagimonas sp. TaxID=1618102 RepID=UPI002616CB4A|nr:hypothetical protein [uncultured Pelagimonas sp.]